MLFDGLLQKLEGELRADLERTVTGFVATARTQLEGVLSEVAKECAKGLAEVAKEKTDLHREIAAMHKHKEAQEGRVVLDIGGHRYTTSVQTLRRLPHTFFDAYFSGRYAMDRCEDGSVFIDRDGEHFGQVLEYLRDGVLSVAERNVADLDVSVLRWLKRDMDFYCIELMAEPQEVAFAVGGADENTELASMERYDAASGAWREVAAMATRRKQFGMCELNGELYATGGIVAGGLLASVESYDPSLDTWSAAPDLPRPLFCHCACVVGDAMYVLGGIEKIEDKEHTMNSVLKLDSLTQTWSEVAPMPAERDSTGVCVMSSDIYIFGGGDGGGKATSTTYRYSTDTNTWATLAPMPEDKCYHSVCVLDGLIYVMGGEDSNGVGVNTVHRFDPTANSWSAMAPMSVDRTGLRSFVLDGSIHAIGGLDEENETGLTSMKRYCVASDSWSEVSGGELSEGRNIFGAYVMLLEVNLFDSLTVKAKRARQ
jgi:N-acetylneuraminic acid mutarotase